MFLNLCLKYCERVNAGFNNMSEFSLRYNLPEASERGFDQTTSAACAFMAEINDEREVRKVASGVGSAKDAEDKRTPAELVQDAVAKFNKAVDKNAALEQLKDDFSRAIKRADEQLEAVSKRVMPSLRSMANEMSDALARVNPAVVAVFVAADKDVPKQDKQAMTRTIAKYLHAAPSNPEHAILRKQLEPYPKVLEAADRASKELKDAQPTFRRYDPPAKELRDAGFASYEARRAYADCLRKTGKTKEADALEEEASNVLDAHPDPAIVALRMKEELKKTMKNFEKALGKP